MRPTHPLKTLLVATAVLIASGCGLGTDAEPTPLLVPKDVFPAEVSESGEVNLSADSTFHPVFFFRDELLVEIQRRLPAPVFLDAPLNNLLNGPTDIEAESGYASAIPAGTAIVDVALLRNNTISIHLNQTFFEIEGEQRIRASAQLVLTASALIRDTQGVVFFLEGKPVQLPDGEGLIEEVPEGRSPSPLTVDDYVTLTMRD